MTDPTLSPQDLLRQTSQPQAAAITFTLPDSAPIHAVEVDKACALTLWRECRGLLDGTGYIPIVTNFWGMRCDSWATTAASELPHATGRFFFDEEVQRSLPGMRSAAPAAIIASAANVDAHRAIEDYARGIQIQKDEVDWALERLECQYGQAPDRALLARALSDASPWTALQRATVEWTRSQGLRPASSPPVPWYEPTEPMALLFLPVSDAEQALAYLHWWGSSVVGSPATIALLARWRRDFGAQLACHFGTMLQLYVERPPRDLDTAFELALELETLAPTGEGGELAWHLMEADRWFLHNRP